jgi:predicted ferric reductase
MAMGNVVALMLFSGRNNPLLYVTDWSYATYLLMHRWLGYWAVAHTIIHSCMLWGYYIRAGTYAAEVARAYWTWGIVGTVGVCALIPLSMGWMRKRAYEGFVVMHGALTVVFLVGYYYHIWYVYGYNWGYEIWMFAAAGIWALERLMRVIRMGLQGTCTTVVSEVLDTDGEYIRIVIENKDLKRGVAYLCFPTLRWQFWETHPFSVSGAVEADSEELEEFEASPAGRSGPCDTNEKEATKHTIASTSIDRAETLTRKGSTVFFARARSGITRVLAAKALAAGGRSIRLRVLIDGPYKYSSHNDSQIDRCSSILCIAGGVGITACLPFLKKNNAEECKLFWSSRQSGLVAGVAHTLRALPSNVKVEITVGKRLDLDAVLSEEMAEGDGTKRGPLAIVVSGPPGLANDVRFKVTQIGRHSGSNRQYMLVDEAFSW